MLVLFFALLITAAALIVVLWIGTYFFQGYIYTMPTPGLFWQAPAAGVFMAFGFGIWALVVALTDKATPNNIPITVLHKFTPREDMLDRPAPKIWAIRKEKRKSGEVKELDEVAYVSKRTGQNRYVYKDTASSPGPWQSEHVVAIDMETADGAKMRFDLAKTESGEYRQFVSGAGWVIHEYDEGPTGLPIKFRFSRLFWNVAFNFAHLIGWFLALWVFLRFQWSHAFGFALVGWAFATLLYLPVLLSFAGEVAVKRQVKMAMVIVSLPCA